MWLKQGTFGIVEVQDGSFPSHNIEDWRLNLQHNVLKNIAFETDLRIFVILSISGADRLRDRTLVVEKVKNWSFCEKPKNFFAESGSSTHL